MTIHHTDLYNASVRGKMGDGRALHEGSTVSRSQMGFTVTDTTNYLPGRACWVDASFDNIDRAEAFYTELLGWDIESGMPQFGGYRNARVRGNRVAGLSPKMDPAQPSAWTTYLATNDSAATINAAREGGAQIIVGEMVVGDFGTMNLFIDPTGAFTGAWQGNTHKGFEVWGEPGAVCWSEHWSRDLAQARDFYSALFGYSYEKVPNDHADMVMFATEGDHLHYGLMAQMTPDMPDTVPAYWMTYFGVTNMDSALETLTKHGGHVAHGPIPTPHGVVYVVQGPEQETFSLIELGKQA